MLKSGLIGPDVAMLGSLCLILHAMGKFPRTALDYPKANVVKYDWVQLPSIPARPCGKQGLVMSAQARSESKDANAAKKA